MFQTVQAAPMTMMASPIHHMSVPSMPPMLPKSPSPPGGASDHRISPPMTSRMAMSESRIGAIQCLRVSKMISSPGSSACRNSFMGSPRLRCREASGGVGMIDRMTRAAKVERHPPVGGSDRGGAPPSG